MSRGLGIGFREVWGPEHVEEVLWKGLYLTPTQGRHERFKAFFHGL